ncbi:hypothetical protein EDD86DRAFT_276757, partial [Gorgonomyces haynaldii]
MPSLRKGKKASSPTKKGVSKKTKEEDANPIMKSLVDEILSKGDQIKQVISKKTFPADSKIARQNQIAAAIQARVVSSAIGKDAPKQVKEAREQLNTAILKKAVGEEIKQMGSRPISLVTKTAVSKGLDLKSLQAKPTISAHIEPERIPRLIAKELSVVGDLKPSEIDSKRRLAPAKIAVNTEIVKRAVIAEELCIEQLDKEQVKSVLRPEKDSQKTEKPVRDSQKSEKPVKSIEKSVKSSQQPEKLKMDSKQTEKLKMDSKQTEKLKMNSQQTEKPHIQLKPRLKSHLLQKPDEQRDKLKLLPKKKQIDEAEKENWDPLSQHRQAVLSWE